MGAARVDGTAAGDLNRAQAGYGCPGDVGFRGIAHHHDLFGRNIQAGQGQRENFPVGLAHHVGGLTAGRFQEGDDGARLRFHAGAAGYHWVRIGRDQLRTTVQMANRIG